VRTQAQVIGAKRTTDPHVASDHCYLGGDFTNPITDMVRCEDALLGDARLKSHASPRQVAGGPLAENILNCRLKPLNSADYASVVFTSAQWARLQATFPDGVCDWSRPGVGQQEAISPLTFAAGPGGAPLLPEPV
jgi:Tannase-like family of unknown function (DUF6351)